MTVTEVRGLRRVLTTYQTDDPTSMSVFVPELRKLLDCDGSIAYGMVPDGDRARVDFVEIHGLQVSAAVWASFVEERSPAHGLFDSLRPDASQRNRVMLRRELGDISSTPSYAVMWTRYGLTTLDQIRVLVCDGPTMLGFVGGYRDGRRPFTERERRRLRALVPALRKRLSLERAVRAARYPSAALDVLLEALDAPAFLVTSWSAVRAANAAGRVLLEHDRAEATRAIRDSAVRTIPGIESTTVVARGTPEHRLVVFTAGFADPAPRVARATARWGLTRRQAEVLREIAHGRSNRTIAVALGCMEGTIELHVSAILAKAQAESRGELVARVWSGE